MNVLILGSGGREHAFAHQIAQSSLLNTLYVAPGNAGTHPIAHNIPMDILNFEEIKTLVVDRHIELVIVGPEAPLVAGISDYFKSDPLLKNVMLIGPSQEGATLEGSKEYAKQFMSRHTIPTAAYQSFTPETLEQGYVFLESLDAPYVLKADGLAAGKGVLIIEDLNEAKGALKEMLQGQFGDASSTVVIEEFLNGIELSVFVLTDGKNYKVLPAAKDYKRIGEGDTGLNTGGMGAVSPVPFASEAFMKKVEERIIKPTIDGFHKEHIDYKGFVFIGLIKVGDDPKVIEYNVRMGDPETEVVLPRIESDLLEILIHTGKGTLDKATLIESDKVGVTLMMVSGGYPETYEKGKPITGLENTEGVTVFHAGTAMYNDGTVETSGGRVLTITSLATNLQDALDKAYENASKINFEGAYYRKDIGKDVL